MSLSMQEQLDLEDMLQRYLDSTSWAKGEKQRSAYIKAGQKKHLDDIDRKRRLATRLIEGS